MAEKLKKTYTMNQNLLLELSSRLHFLNMIILIFQIFVRKGVCIHIKKTTLAIF